MGNKEIKNAKKVLETISQDERERRLAELREKYRMDQHAIMLAGYDKGLKAGIEQGIEQGIKQGIKQGVEQGITQGKHESKNEIAKELLKIGIPIEQITIATGLNEDEIKKLK